MNTTTIIEYIITATLASLFFSGFWIFVCLLFGIPEHVGLATGIIAGVLFPFTVQS